MIKIFFEYLQLNSLLRYVRQLCEFYTFKHEKKFINEVIQLKQNRMTNAKVIGFPYIDQKFWAGCPTYLKNRVFCKPRLVKWLFFQ